MSLDPRARQRVQTVSVRATFSKDATNADLLAQFERSSVGKIAAVTIQHYSASLKNAILYFRNPDGTEVPARRWTKEMVWDYIHFIESNYCRFFQTANFQGDPTAKCKQKVWIGLKPTQQAVQSDCSGCKLFEPSYLDHRLNALNRFFKFLTRLGVIESNFVRDIVSEHREDKPEPGHHEKRRNPSVEDMRLLVNGTAHPRNRAFYACSAKWWFRPNEMLLLDRYTSFSDDASLVTIPDVKGPTDKRKGNRTSVIDAELKPILTAYFTWWEATVKRDKDGKPTTTALWLTDQGNPISNRNDACKLRADFYETFFYKDCERLGLMQPEDREDSLKRWTAHCQRHFGEKLLMMHNVPDTWAKHFRGDAVQDARKHYFVPTPAQVREKYLELVPMIGFKPVPEVPRVL